VRTALKVRPDDDGLKGNLRLYESHLAIREVEDQLAVLETNGRLRPEVRSRMVELLHSNSFGTDEHVPGPAKGAPAKAVPAEAGLDVVIYVGPGPEPWNPDTASKSGIGGSETAAMEMARRLVERGSSVRVYGDCELIEGKFDGVEYVHHRKFRDVECDVLITSRRPHVVDDEFRARARAVLCWVHDVHLGSALTHARSLRIDRFLTLSQWHRNFFLKNHKFVHPDQVLVTRNGIDLRRFAGKDVLRNPHRAVYSSSPDRGLDVALRAWPSVRARVPDAELHVYYGFQTWESSTTDPGQLDLIRYLKDLIKKNEGHGVVYHGRIAQDELALEFLRSGVWAYPTWFSETSCITAMEAQAAGLRMVTSPIAALKETVGDRGTMIQGDWLSPDYMGKWVDSVVDAMSRPDDGDRRSLSKYAVANFGWDSLADDWMAMLRKAVEDVERDIVPPYKEAV
jgi:glycosyltransferase involved in cell wall biosynthesis